MPDPTLPPGYMLFDPAPPAGYTLTPNDPLVDPNTGQPARVRGGTNTPGTDLGYGLYEPLDNARHLLSRGLVAISPTDSALGRFADRNLADSQKTIDEARQRYTQVHGGPPDDSAFRLAGNMLPEVGLGYAMPGSTSASLLPRVASNAVTGGITSLLTGNPNALPSELGGEAAGGALAGIAGAAGTGAGARIAEPRMSLPGSDVRKLMDVGVRPTIGQASGGFLNTIEQGLSNTIPFVGDMIKSARRRAAGVDLDTGVINDVLAPINKELPKGMEVGRPALNYMADESSAAYRAAVPRAGAPLDQTAQDALDAIKSRRMSASNRDELNGYLQDYVYDRLSPTGHLTGEHFKSAESDLGREANGFLYNRNSRQDDLKLGQALRDAQSVLRENLERNSPADATALQAANQTYSRMKVVERAVKRPGQDPGVFSPAQLQEAAYGNTLSGNVKMRGGGPYQELSDSARRVLGATIPDSGTPRGLAIQALATGGLLGGGTALGQIDPDSIPKYLAGAGALGAVYNPYTQPLIAHLMASRHPALAAAIARSMRSATPLVTTGLATEGGLLGR